MANIDTGQYDILDDLRKLIKIKFAENFTVVPVSTGKQHFLSVWQAPACDSAYGPYMQYLPMFYAIVSVDNDRTDKLSLKLITFHGKVVDQINEADHPLMTNEDKLSFVGKIERLRPCKGIEMPDDDLKLDARTFSSMYIVERLQEAVVVRSYHCQYALYEENASCKMCRDLSVAYDSEQELVRNQDEEFTDAYRCQDDVGISLDYVYGADTKSCFDIDCGIETDDINHIDLKQEYSLEHMSKPSSKTKRRNRENFEDTDIENTNKKHRLGDRYCKQTIIKCKHCAYHAIDIQQLMSHNISVHSPGFNGGMSDEIQKIESESCDVNDIPRGELVSRSENNQIKFYQCQLCDTTLEGKSALKLHIRNEHKRPYKCRSCPYETSQESRLSRHIKSVHEKLKRYFCDQCSYAASDNYSLKFHVMAVHEKLKPFICEHCTHSTTTQKALRIHIKAVHEKLKPFICEHCSTGFATKYMLQMHVTVVHEKVKGYKCKQCSYETARKYYLDHHIKSVHEKMKQFKCDLCTFETAVKCNLKNHVLAVHEKSKPFQCPHCSFEAIRKKQLTLHLCNIHGE